MRRITLTFAQRIQLMGILDAATAQDGGREKMISIDNLYKKIMFSGEERKRYTIVNEDGNVFAKLLYPCARCDGYTATKQEVGYLCTKCGSKFPEGTFPDFGEKTVEVEDAEMLYARKQMDVWEPNMRRRDIEWYFPLRESFEVCPVVRPGKGKK